MQINQLLFADDRALVTNSEENCKLASEFGRVCKSSMLRVKVGKNIVIRCFRYVNVAQMDVRLKSNWQSVKRSVLSSWGHKWQGIKM